MGLKSIDWKATYCVLITLTAFVLVGFTTSDMYDAKHEAAYWHCRYDLLAGTLLGNEFDPELVADIPGDLWAMPEIRARAYTYLARWVQTTPAAEHALNAHWQVEPDDGLREMAETALRRPR